MNKLNAEDLNDLRSKRSRSLTNFCVHILLLSLLFLSYFDISLFYRSSTDGYRRLRILGIGMNTLVTGVTGSISSNLVGELLKAGGDVRVLDEMHTEKGPHLQPN